MSIYDIISDEDIDLLRGTLSDNENDLDMNENVDIYLHFIKGGAQKELCFDKNHSLVKLSGYFTKWAPTKCKQTAATEDAKNCDEHHCGGLPRKYTHGYHDYLSTIGFM